MKGAFNFDLHACDYGEATVAIRSILSEWEQIDWFEAHSSDPAAAIRLFEEHQAKARMIMPDVYPERIAIHSAIGDWADCHAWCQRVRAPGAFDWKYGVLKKLCAHFTNARGWLIEKDSRLATPEDPPSPSDLFFRVGDTAVWNSIGPVIQTHETLRHDDAEIASWYHGYATSDLMECLQCQLALRNDDATTNPFVPLLRCYAAGFYPIGLARDEVVLFAFEKPRG
jgi:hypothetical protein